MYVFLSKKNKKNVYFFQRHTIYELNSKGSIYVCLPTCLSHGYLSYAWLVVCLTNCFSHGYLSEYIIYLSGCLPVYLTPVFRTNVHVYLSISSTWLSTCLLPPVIFRAPAYLSIYLTHLSACPSAYLLYILHMFAYLQYLCTCLPVYLSNTPVCLSISLSPVYTAQSHVCLSTCLSIYAPVYLSGRGVPGFLNQTISRIGSPNRGTRNLHSRAAWFIKDKQRHSVSA